MLIEIWHKLFRLSISGLQTILPLLYCGATFAIGNNSDCLGLRTIMGTLPMVPDPLRRVVLVDFFAKLLHVFWELLIESISGRMIDSVFAKDAVT